MGRNLTQKIVESHLMEGRLVPGEEIGVRVDQALLQDATGTMAMLEFEAMGLPRSRIELACVYVDHNLLQTDHKNPDDHRYLQTAAARYGLHFSRPGNGVSHQVHMERFGVPGQILLGADSHTSTGAGVSMLAIGAGGMDVALALAGQPYHFECPRVLGIELTGSLPDWVSPRDVILEMLRRYGVKGCIGKVVEYHGPGVKSLSAGDRAIIGNMGAELGATSSVFPSDENTRAFLKAMGREASWKEMAAGPDAVYDETDSIDLSTLGPLIAQPSSPANVVPVQEVAGTKVDQVIVGSSANSTFEALMTVAELMKGRIASPHVSFEINPASRQVLENLILQGGLFELLRAGARVQQPGCLGCIGMGQAPGTGQVSLRTFPRNFPGRSGTEEDRVYLCSSETAAAAAIKGVITDPRDLGREMEYRRVQLPERFALDDSSIVFPSEANLATEVIRGPNIRPFPTMEPLPDTLEVEVILCVGDNITTDHIMPAGNQVLPLRSNIPAISEFVFHSVDPQFAARARAKGQVAVVGGENYGQGSSREHAALAPRFLGVRVKIAASFARIHHANLCNFGILPLTLLDPRDRERLPVGERIRLTRLRERIAGGEVELPLEVNGQRILTRLDASPRQRLSLLAGSALNLAAQQSTAIKKSAS